jgi:heme exporter protein B
MAHLNQTQQPNFSELNGFMLGLKRDWLLAVRQKGEIAQMLVFFLIVASFFPLAIGAETAILARVGAGVVWVSGLLAVLLTMPRLFATDYADGTLEQLICSGFPLASVCAGKIVAHWLSSGLLLTIVSPFVGLQFGLKSVELGVLAVSLLLGTPLLSMLGAIASALTLGLRGGAILTALLVLPLFVPVLIFGAGCVSAAQSGLEYTAQLYLLGAGLLVGAVGTPFAAAAAVKISLD